jgi:hypothetical protein
MGKLKIKDGTPVGNDNLCTRCKWGQCMTGYRESDRLVLCTNTYQNLVVPFTVLDCTNFSDKHRPDWKQMQQLAIRVGSVRVSKKTTGFGTAVEEMPIFPPELDDDDEEEDEAAFAGWSQTIT